MSTDIASESLDNAETNTLSSKKEVKKAGKSLAKISAAALLGLAGSKFKKKVIKKVSKQPKKTNVPPSKDKKEVEATNNASLHKKPEIPIFKDQKENKATNKASQPQKSETPPLKDKKEVRDNNMSQPIQIHETKSMSVVPEEWTRPFKLGWRREIVYRGIQNPAKQSKQCDIYYFTPDHAKLRSLPMITDYLAKTNSDLTKECFSFSKQKIYSEPQEIVRNAGEKNGATRNVTDDTKIKKTKAFPNVKKNGSPVTRRKSRKVETESKDLMRSTKDDSMKEDIKEIFSSSLPSSEQNLVSRELKRKLGEDEEDEEIPQKKNALCDETGRSPSIKKEKLRNKESSVKKVSKKSLDCIVTCPTNAKRKLVKEETSNENSSEKLSIDNEICNSPVTKKRKLESHENNIEEKSLIKSFNCGDIESKPMNHDSILHCKSNESYKATEMDSPKEETEVVDDSNEILETPLESEYLKGKLMGKADNDSFEKVDEMVTHADNETEKDSFENDDELVTRADNETEKNSFENDDELVTHADNETEKDSFENDDELVTHADNETEKDSFENDDELVTRADNETEKDSFENDDELVTRADNETEKDSFENDDELVTRADNETEKNSFENDDELVTHADNETEKDSFENDDELVTRADNETEKDSFEKVDELVTRADNETEKDSFENDDELVTCADNETEKDSFEKVDELVTRTDNETEKDSFGNDDELVTRADNETEKDSLQLEVDGRQTMDSIQQEDSSMLLENILDEKENISETLQESNAKFQELVEGRVLREILPEVDNSLAQDAKLGERKHADVSSEISAFHEEVTNDLNEQYLKSGIAKKKIMCNVCMHKQESDSDDSLSGEAVCEACMTVLKENESIKNYKCEPEIKNNSYSQPDDKDEGCVTQSVDTMSLTDMHTIVVDENILSLLDVSKKFYLLIKNHTRLIEPGNTFVDSSGLNIRLKNSLPSELMRPSQPLKVTFDDSSDIQRLIVQFDEESLS